MTNSKQAFDQPRIRLTSPDFPGGHFDFVSLFDEGRFWVIPGQRIPARKRPECLSADEIKAIAEAKGWKCERITVLVSRC